MSRIVLLVLLSSFCAAQTASYNFSGLRKASHYGMECGGIDTLVVCLSFTDNSFAIGDLQAVRTDIELACQQSSIFPVVIFQRNTISVPDRRPPHYVSIFADQSEHAQSGYLAFKRRFSWTAGKEKYEYYFDAKQYYTDEHLPLSDAVVAVFRQFLNDLLTANPLK